MTKTTQTITLADRLEHGELTLLELSTLKSVCLTKLYHDIKTGKLPVVKRGRSTRVLGKVARAYVPGTGIVEAA